MVQINLKGVYTVRAKGRTYHYAWRGGPRLVGEPGSPEFVAAYTAAHAERKAPVTGTLQQIVTNYRASPEFKRLGEHTRRAYSAQLDAIALRFGSLPLAALNHPEVRRHFIAWRDTMADRPRTADMHVGTLKMLLAWAVERVMIRENHAAPISRLHRVDKSEDIWTAEDFEALRRVASREVWWAVQLGLHTGLRQSDLIRLGWGHVRDGAIDFRTSKRNRPALIPVTPALEGLLGRIERRGPVILTTQRGKRPWTADGLRSSFAQACQDAGVERTFHDLRRTAATVLLAAGLDAPQVALIMGWSEGDVEAMKRRYVARSAVVQAMLAKLAQAG